MIGPDSSLRASSLHEVLAGGKHGGISWGGAKAWARASARIATQRNQDIMVGGVVTAH
jgi:hypothetical protein